MNSYQVRINKVLSHIDFHLDEKQDLNSLAEMAFLSKFHFHRIMSSYLGEPLAVYINRIKLEKAAILLKYSDNPIEKIAYTIGYESPTSFTKSFKKAFKVSPTDFKRNNAGNFTIKPKLKAVKQFDLSSEIRQIKPFKALTYQVKGKVGDEKTYEGWAGLVSFSSENCLIDALTKYIAVHWDDPTITKEHNLRYDACISINKELNQTGKFTLKQFPGGKYLCVSYQGDYMFLPDVYNQIFKTYIFKHNFRLREEPVFEELLNSINDTPKKKLVTVIHIPIE
ncbi:MAG: AraC family transcriptional regulator [Bacteroidales bacterium]|nr:AraC family transcriptional regulator [Bacteroidales bacterium]